MYIVYRMSEIHGLTEFLKVKAVDLSVHLTLMNALKKLALCTANLDMTRRQIAQHFVYVNRPIKS